MNSPPTLRFGASRASSRIGLLCVVILASIGIAKNLSGLHFKPGAGVRDDFSRYLRRFEPMRFAMALYVPPQTRHIGYVGDSGDDTFRVVAQYALAPIILVPDPRPFPLNMLDPALRGVWQPPETPRVDLEWFVGDFHSPDGIQAILRTRRLFVVRDFGDGVLLLKRVPL